MSKLHPDIYSHIIKLQNIDELCSSNISKKFQSLQKDVLISLLVKLRYDPYKFDQKEDVDIFTNKLLINHNIVYYINEEFQNKKPVILNLLNKQLLIRSIIEYDTKEWSYERKSIPEIDIGDVLTDIGFSYREYVELSSFTEFVIALVLSDIQLKNLLKQLTKSQICNIFKILFRKFTKETIMDSLKQVK